MGLVTVALKYPSGIHLDVKGKPRVTIRGFSTEYGVAPQGIIGGYALTPNVDEETFNEWMKINKDHDLVKNMLIFAHSKVADATSQAREMTDQQSGLEPLDPNKPGKGIERVGA